MTMKRFSAYFLTLVAMISCTPEGSGSETGSAVPLSADKTSLQFTADGGEQTFKVTSSEKVMCVPYDGWYTLKQSTSGTVTTVVVTAEANGERSERLSRISVNAGEEKRYVEVKQDPFVPVPAPEPGSGPAWQVAQKLGIGWNLGNHFDAHYNGVSGETFWGNPMATQATFDKVKAAGFSTVRIPVTWMGHIGDAPDYKIEDAWLDRVAEVVGYAENAGLNAIVNMHHDGADSKYWLDIAGAASDASKHQQITAQVSAMWRQIADKLKDKGEFLIFEAFNEIHDGGWGWGANRTDGEKQYKCLNDWNQAFVDAVRASGGGNADRLLGIPAYCTNVDIAVESFVLPEDSVKDRLMVSVHCYDPYDYTLPAKCSEWGHTADPTKKVAGDNEAALKSVFEKISRNFISKDIPVYLGEFGCVNRATEREQAFQQYYLAYFAKLAKTYGVPCMIWDNGAKGAGNECHAFIDHGTGEYCSPEAQAAIEAMLTSYGDDRTLDEVYDSAPKK